MKTVSFSELGAADLDVRDVVVFPAVWAERKQFSEYKNTPRATSAFFLILSDVRGIFTAEDGTRTEITRGDVVYLPAGIRYHAEFLGGRADTRIDTYTVNFRLLDKTGEEVRLADGILRLAGDQSGLFDTYFHRLAESTHPVGASGNLFRQKADFYALVDALLTHNIKRKELYYPIRRGIEALCHDWNKNERIEVYAALCGMSEGYFYRLFRRATGMSPVEYRNLLRVSNACSILKNTRFSVREVSAIVGYDDPFYFCRIFKKHTGSAPMDYRKSNLDIDIPE